MDYIEFKEKNSKKLNDFIGKYFIFAFNQKQYEAKLKELNLSDEEFKKKYVGFLGGAIPKNKVDEYISLSKEANRRLKDKLYSDFNFVKSAFNYELVNHEAYYSLGDGAEEALNALGLTQKDLENNELLMRAYKVAKSEYWAWCNENC